MQSEGNFDQSPKESEVNCAVNFMDVRNTDFESVTAICIKLKG